MSRTQSLYGYSRMDEGFTLRVDPYSDRSGNALDVYVNNIFGPAELRSNLAPQIPLLTAVVYEGAGVHQVDGCVVERSF